jgi:hypothetical protein
MRRRMLINVFALAFVAASVAGGAVWLMKDPREHVVISPAGGCENPPPDVGCDPYPAETAPRGHMLWILAALAAGGAVFGLAYVVLARRARRFENPAVPPARML